MTADNGLGTVEYYDGKGNSTVVGNGGGSTGGIYAPKTGVEVYPGSSTTKAKTSTSNNSSSSSSSSNSNSSSSKSNSSNSSSSSKSSSSSSSKQNVSVIVKQSANKGKVVAK